MVNALRKIKEVRLIERIAGRFKVKDRSVIVSIGDDAAVVRGPQRKYLIFTSDMLIESVHFKKSEDYQKVGYKAMAVSISDIAAMGGIPKYALISVGLPKKNVDRIAGQLFTGIESCAKKFGIEVVGGDTNRSDKLIIDVFAVGEVEPDKVVLRSTAQSGDHIFVSGPLGGSFRGKHLSFTPRVMESRFLVKNFKVTSMIDLSDGLGMDLNRICDASGVGALIFENKIPKSKGVFKTEAALFDGEDFELLFTLSKEDGFRFFHMMDKRKADMRFYQIGRITDLFRGVKMVTRDGKVKDVSCDGFKHFQKT